MKKIIWTLCILSFAIVQNAQVPEINWGQKYSVRGFGKAINQKSIGHTNEYIFIRHKDKKHKSLIQFDFEDKIINVTYLDFRFKGEEVLIYKIINTASGDYLLGNNHNKKLNKSSVHTVPISTSGQIGKSLEYLYTFDYKRHQAWHTNDRRNQDVSGVKLSQDSTKVLFANVTSNKDHRKKKYKDEYIINVFNDKLEKLWEKKIEFPYADKEMVILQYEISNIGDVYILTKNQVSEKRTKWCPSYDFTLVKISKDGNVGNSKIDLGHDYAKEANIQIDKDGNIIALGYFTEQEKRNVDHLEHGVFFNKYNSKGEILIQKKHRWTEDFYTKLKEEYNLKIDSYARSEGFYINGISADYTRNSISLISEYRYQVAGNSNNGGQTTTQMFNHANHLIIPSFDLDGNLKWTSCIEKKSRPPYFTDNTIFTNQDGFIYLIFNASKSLKERSKTDGKNKYRGIFTDFARINSQGEVDIRETIFHSQETGVYFAPQNSGFIGNGMMLIFGRDNKNARHGLLKLP